MPSVLDFLGEFTRAGLDRLARELRTELREVQVRARLIDRTHKAGVEASIWQNRRPPLFAAELREAQRFKLVMQIMRAARAGKSNGEIGELTGLHPNSVSRIIQRELRRARPVAVARQHEHRAKRQRKPQPARDGARRVEQPEQPRDNV